MWASVLISRSIETPRQRLSALFFLEFEQDEEPAIFMRDEEQCSADGLTDDEWENRL